MTPKKANDGRDYSYSKLLENDRHAQEAPAPDRRSQPKERCTFYIYPDQTVKIDELILKLRQADPKLRLDKSGVVRVALDLLAQMMDATDLQHLLLLFSGDDLEEALPRLLVSELVRRQDKETP